MERTRIRLAGIELDSSVMNASGPLSAERESATVTKLPAARAGVRVRVS